MATLDKKRRKMHLGAIVSNTYGEGKDTESILRSQSAIILDMYARIIKLESEVKKLNQNN